MLLPLPATHSKNSSPQLCSSSSVRGSHPQYGIRHLCQHICTGFCTSNPSDARQGIQSTNICIPGSSDQPVYLWLVALSQWDPKIQATWNFWSSYGVVIPFSSFNPSHNSSEGVPEISLMFECKYMHLSWSAAGKASQRIAMLGSCLQEHNSLINIVRVGCIPMGSIPTWVCHFSAIPSVTGPFFTFISFR